ncbi:MAG TPA: hypothetical protein PLA94_09260, partial [Myxococcota bacterium]|nr:hypothetical protein [Myxococcota bacterium]
GTSDCFVPLRSLPELRRALQVPGDILFYYYGHGASGSIQSYGEEGESWIPVLELARLLPEDRVKLVFLNTCMGGEGGWLSSLWQLSAVSPIVLSHHTSVLRDVAQERALSVWTSIFRGTHPTTAFCDIPPSSPIQSSEWWCGAVVDQTNAWTVDAPARAAHLHDPLWAWRLDRTQQRDFILGRLREMVNTGRPSRSQVFLVYGPPRNHIDMFASSLEDRLLAEVESACIRRYRMDLPPPAQVSHHEAWDQCLRAALGVGAELPLSDALGRLEGELRPDPGERALLWLQVEATPRARYPEEKGVRSAVEGALTALSRWRSDLPKHLRIAMLLPMEVPEENLGKVESWGNGLELDHSSPEAGCYLVNPPLSAVSVRDLYLFLAHHQDAERSDQVQRELARAIHERCQGSYAGAVELLQRGARIGFAALRTDLRPQAPKGDDF